VFKQRKLRALVARRLELDQVLHDDRAGSSVVQCELRIKSFGFAKWECRPFGFYPWREVDQFGVAQLLAARHPLRFRPKMAQIAAVTG
jgi:hypothetical protein